MNFSEKSEKPDAALETSADPRLDQQPGKLDILPTGHNLPGCQFLGDNLFN